MRGCGRRARAVASSVVWVAGLLSAAGAGARQAASVIWIEGEAAQCNVKPNIAGWGRKEFLSGEQWLHVSIDADKVDSQTPVGGILMTYPIHLATAGAYEVWDRIGFEFARTPFEWRVDNSAWQRVLPDQLTCDLMELDLWCEVAWLKLGDAALTAGSHTLEVRLPRTADAKGQRERMLYASDAICLSPTPFRPNGRLKPGEMRGDALDAEAAKQTFQVPEMDKQGRTTVAMKGAWEICRADEQTPAPVAEPIRDLPADPVWTGIPVPGDKNTLRPDLLMAHRIWYRTRVNLPSGAAGRSCFLRFPQNNLNTTVVVNGIPCGFNKNPFVLFDIDVTKAIRPGVNEVLVGIRDAWYAYSYPPSDPSKLRRQFNLPPKFLGDGFQRLAYPIWNHAESGLLQTPEFWVAGRARAADVFVRPSVARKELAADITVSNPGAEAVTARVKVSVLDRATGKVALELPGKEAMLQPGSEQTLTVAAPWAAPRLWWPDAPHLYLLRAVVETDAGTPDICDTPFGFREWSWAGRDFRLNGIPWRLWTDCHAAATPAEWLADHRTNGHRMMRFWGTTWMGMSPEKALDTFDQNGVVVRRSGMLDGEAIGYMAIEEDAELKRLGGSDVKMDLMRNWKDQLVAQVRGERNHPSVMIWSIENEWLYINCINLYGGMMDAFEREVKTVADAVMAVDPTRPLMTDGGGANKDQSMPVHGNHYVFDPGNGRYPDLAYETNAKGGGRDRWVWDEKRPRFMGEDFFATGINPFDYAYYGGEETFQGKAQSRRAAGIIYRMLTEGYRWVGQSAWQFWMGQGDATGQYVSQAERAAFCREWNWTFKAGSTVKRTIGVFNDSRFSDPLTFTAQLVAAGKAIWRTSRVCTPAPGASQRFTIDVPIPASSGRKEYALLLALTTAGKEVFRDTKAVSALGATEPIAPQPAGAVGVYDPSGAVVGALTGLGVKFTRVTSLPLAPAACKVLIIGPDALTAAEAASSRLAAAVASGRRLIVLEQKHPLRYQGLPAEMEAAQNEGRTAYFEDMTHPIAAGLKQKDLWTWGVDLPVYRDAYAKPSRGAKSLIQCHMRLANTAMAEAPVGSGLMLLCQLAVGRNASTNAVAGRLLSNMLRYALEYKLEYRPVAAAVEGDKLFAAALEKIGLKHTKAQGPLQALATPGAKIAVIEAGPQNLKALAGAPDAVRRFTAAGGWLFLHGLSTEGLADYNKVVGVDHMVRPFRQERVTFPAVRHPLTAGLTNSDVVMYSGERIFGWTADEFVASDIFNACVDYDEVAPFAKLPSDYHYNMVNGMVSADAWKYIFSFDLTRDKPEFIMEFPKPQELTGIEWIGNAFYHLVTRLELSDGVNTAALAVKPGNEPQSLEIKPAVKGSRITLKITDWAKVSTGANVVGVDNIRLTARRSPEFLVRVHPLLNNGGLMQYDMGKGGIVLCNLLIKEREQVPDNATKKLRILSALLRNLRAPFSGSATVIAGENLDYEPVDLSKAANQYKDARACFGDRERTLADLPNGKNTFAGVPYNVYSFATSPVPTIVMLGGSGVPGNLPDAVRGIAVNRKADALFFLQSARIDQGRDDRERREGKRYEFARYVVHYADGQTAAIPLCVEIDTADYRQDVPQAMPGAQLAWSKPFAGGGGSAVAYSKQWNNPRPDEAIASVDLEYGPDRRGVPALLALTVARRR